MLRLGALVCCVLGVACHTPSAARDDGSRLTSATVPSHAGAVAPSTAEAVAESSQCKPSSGRRSLFVAAWPEARRASLLQALKQGRVAVRATECSVELLPACDTKAEIAPQSRLNCCDPRGVCGTDDLNLCDSGRELYSFDSADELYSNFPNEARSLVPELKGGRALRLRAESNSALQFNQVNVPSGGACQTATHYIKQARLGSFEVDLAASETWNAPSLRKLASAGTPGACGNGAAANAAGCDQPFFIELASLDDAGSLGDRLQCVGQARPHVVGQVGGLPLLKDHPDVALRPLAKSAGNYGVCSVFCSSSDRVNCEKQCSGGKTTSCVALALNLDGDANPAERSQRTRLLEQACAKDNGSGCFALAADLDRVGTDATSAKAAVDAYARACRTGIGPAAARACSTLALRYKTGSHGVAVSAERAVEHYRRACELGYEGCQPLAMMLLTGDGIAKDVPAGIELLRRACHVNSRAACIELGRRAVKGDGVAKDRELGIAYLKLGCDSLQRTSCQDLQRLGVKVPARYVE